MFQRIHLHPSTTASICLKLRETPFECCGFFTKGKQLETIPNRCKLFIRNRNGRELGNNLVNESFVKDFKRHNPLVFKEYEGLKDFEENHSVALLRGLFFRYIDNNLIFFNNFITLFLFLNIFSYFCNQHSACI